MPDNLAKFDHVDLLFPSNYLKGVDLQGREVTVEIESIDPRHDLMRDGGVTEQKPTITLKGKTKKWVLNKTNAKTIASLYGNEASGWIGKSVTLFTKKVRNPKTGGMTDAIRVKASKP